MEAAVSCPVSVCEGLERAGGDLAFYRELLWTFVNELPERLDAIEGGARDSDLQLVVREAHAVKGAAANLAATHIEATSAEIEDAARQRSATRLNELVIRLRREVAQLRTFCDEMP